MQPYFYPYAGYFRLFAGVDEFVILDCVQFPRRGRVHRCEVPGPRSEVEWLTLPLAYQPREVLIRDLAFASDARNVLNKRLSRLPWFNQSKGLAADRIRAHLCAPMESLVDYLENGLRLVTDLLDLNVPIRRSSALKIDQSLRGQARIIAIANTIGATHYLNSPGGRDLYSAGEFARNRISLSFLSPYTGCFYHLLPALMMRASPEIRAEILRLTVLEPQN